MNRQLLFVLAAIVWAISIFIFCAIMASAVHARPFTDAECGGIAKAAQEIAQARDYGAPFADNALAVEAGIKDSKTQPQTFIVDAEDEAMMRALLALIYNNPSISPSNFRSLIKQHCVRHLATI